jgi:aspartate/methionine/tyrosine aminotransferase
MPLAALATTPPRLAPLRPEAAGAPESGIVEVSNYGRGRPGLIPLWVGEGDLPTPAFICDAATRSLAAGETMYTWQRGIPELREAISRYTNRVYGAATTAEQFFVTGGGMQAVQIAMRMVAGPGDEVLIPTPAWPNFAAAASIAGARVVPVPMGFGNAGWTLDTDRLEQAVTPATTAIIINSPANPTGWTASHEDLAAVLALARRHGLWVVADEIYGRFVYAGTRAPSFRDVMQDGDRVLFVQTMSKNWAMTGWRIGWLEAPAALGGVVENLIQYSTSGVPVFGQRAAITAIEEGEAFVAAQIARAGESLARLTAALDRTGRVRYGRPAGAFYLFFSIDGVTDSRRAALALVDEALVGLAPGTAFGEGAESFLRLCFARDPDQVGEAGERLARWIMAQPPR